MKKAVVTGANGFVGAWLVRELTDHGVSVFAVVKDMGTDISAIEHLNGVTIVYCELNNLPQLSEKIADRNIDTFYHLAWSGSTGPARADYRLQLQNTQWTVDAVAIAHVLGCGRFIGAGTLAEHDCSAYIPSDGATPNPVSHYGTAKIAAHYMSKAECANHKIEHIWAYLSNTYGIGNRTQNFVNFASKTMITGKPADFTDGEQPYDFVYVTDVAQALYRLGVAGKANHSYYIGSTKPTPLKEFIFQIRDAINPQISLNLGKIPFNGIPLPTSMFDCSKLVKDTGYAPRVSFTAGIEKTVAWLRTEIAEEHI